MIKKIKNKISLRLGFIFGVLLLIILNLILLTSYYNIVLSSKIKEEYQTVIEELKKEINTITESLEDEDSIDDYLKEYTKNNNVKIVIKDEDGNEKTYINNDKTTYTTTSSGIIKVGDSHYMISISRSNPIIGIKLILSFFIFEFVIVALLSLTGISSANIKILSPITELSKDFSNYKLGILPKKRKKRGEIDNLQNDFVDLVDTLEQEKQKQSRIIASISHDIKTPLTSILGYSERLSQNENLPDETKSKYAKTIYNKSLIMKEIIEEFDNYLSCNIKDESKEEKISIKNLIDYLNEYYKEELKEKNITIKINSNCNNEYILVDFSKIKRVFSNIITNSIRHFDKDKKIININITSEKNDKIKIDIADNGSGTKEDCEKIFEPLYTTDKSRKISGLGLSICKEIITSHNGTIKAFNNKMGGLTISITLNKYKEN